MTPEWMKLIWDVVVSLISVAAFLVAWFGRRDQAHKLAIEKVAQDLAKKSADETSHYSSLKDEIADMGERIGVVEENVKHLPTAGDLRALQQSINQLSNGIGRLEGAQQGTTRQVDLMNSYLMRTEKV